MTAALSPATHDSSRVSVLFLSLSWTRLLEEHQIHLPPPGGRWTEKFFSPRAERGRLSLADGWHQHQPGHENLEKADCACRTGGNYQTHLSKTFALFWKRYSTLPAAALTCSPWALLLLYLPNKPKLLRLPPVGEPASATSAAFCFSSCQPGSSRIPSLLSSAAWDCAPGWPQGHPLPPWAGRRAVGTAFPWEFCSQGYLHFWITCTLMPPEPAGQQLKWSESDSSILCVAGSQEFTSSTWILCFTWTRLQFDLLCFLKRRFAGPNLFQTTNELKASISVSRSICRFPWLVLNVIPLLYSPLQT